MIVELLEMSSRHVERAVEDFNEAQWLHVPGEGLSCASWIVGHAVLVDRQVLEELGVRLLLPIPDEWPSLYQVRPNDELAREYHTGKFIFSPFVAHRKALVRAVAEAAADSLSRELDPPGEERYNPLRGDEDNPLFGYKTLTEMITNMALYTSQLTGELCILRQSLGLPIEEDWRL
jgi:hypothetical protein